MIGQLSGILCQKNPPEVLIDVNGVGYEVQVSMNTFYTLPALGAKTTLITHFVVREDANLLYGFATADERRLFRELIKISGVGPKLALTILSSIKVADFIQLLQENGVTQLTKLPGIGKKTAERLVIEMRDRLSGWSVDGDNSTSISSSAGGAKASSRGSYEEAISALIALGFKPQEATKQVGSVTETGLTSEELIKRALQR